MGAAPRAPAGRSHAHRVRSTCGVAALLAPRDRNKVAATTARPGEPVYFPPHTVPCRPAPILPQGPANPAFRTKGQLAAHLVARARAARIAFRALVADCLYGPCRARKNCPLPPADMAGIVSLYGLRGWTEQGDKHVKHELGWADFQVRSGQAIQRHWTLVDVAFGFCRHQPPQQRAPSRARPILQ
ncbi:hypothetical protein ACH4SK_41220 [Streptomyces inhibens]|uniref:hypothetical protein n=1 Tax=Streptomyces inhibens TaxID=2293571 RepID=UPI00379B525C